VTRLGAFFTIWALFEALGTNYLSKIWTLSVSLELCWKQCEPVKVAKGSKTWLKPFVKTRLGAILGLFEEIGGFFVDNIWTPRCLLQMRGCNVGKSPLVAIATLYF